MFNSSERYNQNLNIFKIIKIMGVKGIFSGNGVSLVTKQQIQGHSLG